MTPAKHREALRARQNVIKSVIDDKIATERLQNTKGKQTIDAGIVKAREKVNQKLEAMEPHIANMKREATKAINATARQAQKSYEDISKLGQEMAAASTERHNQVFHIDMHVDKQKFGTAVADASNRALNKKLVGR